jgi:hypothetical protein
MHDPEWLCSPLMNQDMAGHGVDMLITSACGEHMSRMV